MPVNGKVGSVPKAVLIAQQACFYPFAADTTTPSGNVIPAGTVAASVEYISEVDSFDYDTYIQAPNDPNGFVPVGTAGLISSAWDADDLLAVTGGFENTQPTGCSVTLAQLYQGQGQYTSVAGTFQGQNGLEEWTEEQLETGTNLGLEQATTQQLGGAMSAKEQAALVAVLNSVQVTPYVAPAPETETSEFPPAAKTLTTVYAILVAQNFQRTMTAGPDGMPVCGRSAAPTS